MKKSILIISLLFPLTIISQLISVKSLPLSTGDQFTIFPSQNLSMAGVNIALVDKWGDALNNPGNGSRISNLNLFVLPSFYNISDNLGGASTLPIALFLKNDDWFGTAYFGLQQFEGAKTDSDPWMFEWSRKHSVNKNNQYGYFSIGKKFSNTNWSLGASYFTANLGAVGGVDLLYSGSVNIEQDGNIQEYRTGLYYKNETSSFEAIVLYNKYEMRHDVEYNWVPWSSSFQRPFEINKDKTDTWGLHLALMEKKENSNLNFGAITTINYKSHPKIPNYEIMNIPRDPGNSWCFNIGMGVGSENEKSKFGLDLIYEPIWSNTWADAEQLIELTGGQAILPGQKTIENDFTFSNIIARVGFSRIIDMLELSAGLEIYYRSYSLEQQNYVNNNYRSQEEDWTEYTWSWGAEFHFSYFDIKYTGHKITGAGIPGVSRTTFNSFNESLGSGDLVVAPSGSLSIDYKTTSMHQFIISIPINK